jgi:hypothetical protein
MRCFVLALALLVGFGSTSALAKDQVLVKLRDDSAPKAKTTPAKSATLRTKKKPPIRRGKAVAKSKPKAKAKAKPKTEESRPRPMP